MDFRPVLRGGRVPPDFVAELRVFPLAPLPVLGAEVAGVPFFPAPAGARLAVVARFWAALAFFFLGEVPLSARGRGGGPVRFFLRPRTFLRRVWEAFPAGWDFGSGFGVASSVLAGGGVLVGAVGAAFSF